MIVIPTLAWLCVIPGVAHARTAYVATPQVDFEFCGEPPMRMPTAVAVSAAGSVFVCDGVNDRVLEFGADGSLVGEIRQVGGLTLSRPIGVKVDAQGRLWIADTGNVRVLVRTPDGQLGRVLAVKRGDGEK